MRKHKIQHQIEIGDKYLFTEVGQGLSWCQSLQARWNVSSSSRSTCNDEVLPDIPEDQIHLKEVYIFLHSRNTLMKALESQRSLGEKNQENNRIKKQTNIETFGSHVVTNGSYVALDGSYVATYEASVKTFESHVATDALFVTTYDSHIATHGSSVTTFLSHVATIASSITTDESSVAIFGSHIITDGSHVVTDE
ncbi:hypothetical protein H5410_040597 [Solanum commersonii]|uniref:Uncharacterized protein n=1 Tax=Solanum commersonii TaxID=4109 RepID=A0A9J5XPA0_SOLCO|nr:hypothetical protein H5410_040597 [Solanum commersonii]